MLWCRFLSGLVMVVTLARGEEEWLEDWEEVTGEDREHRFLFPSVEQEEQCQGEKMVLRAGESTSIQSHRGYGYRPYPQDYRCRWIFQPLQCDLAVVCYMRTRMGPRVHSVTSGDCRGGDYLRLMKGDRRGVNFHKKYCGNRSASLKFSGNDTVKLVFKTVAGGRQVDSLQGWTCKVICKDQGRPGPVPATTIRTTTLATTTTTTTTTRTTTTTITTTTTTSTTASPCQCGVVPDSLRRRWLLSQAGRQGRAIGDGRIVCPRGQDCTAGPIPWQVGLISPGQVKPWCGGTLINSRYVLTAAHCLEDPKRRKRGRLLVRLGDRDWTRRDEWPEEVIPADEVLLHPKFRQGALFNFDFAIIKLSRPVDFKAVDWVRPACLPSVWQAGRDYTGVQATVSGWGVTDSDTRKQAHTLQAVKVEILSPSSCLSHYSAKDITANMLCAKKPGADACYGDSGGPFTVQESGRTVLAGVVSWGLECARAKWPGVYSRVDSVLDWVRDNTRDGEFCADRANSRGNENRGTRRAG